MSLSPDNRYRLAIVLIAAGTLLAVGLIGGTVANALGASSVWSGVIIAAIALVGWYAGYRIRERHKLGLPLWGALTEEQAAELAAYRRWVRTGRLTEEPEDPESSARQRSRSGTGRAGRGSGAGGTASGASATSGMSKRDRARRADVERRRALREGDES